MKNLLNQLVKEFKEYEVLESEFATAGDSDKATYYMNKKWKCSKVAEENGIKNEFLQTLKEIRLAN
ncbi:hypothetical protein P4639_14690 [Priestia megaterium]|uniref:hypothetical protein n=1 Tax=Priestia megaterium TaxID=1404 RepID=UPI002E226DC4|nr:hypothetical protein [Priestia megaterium]